MDRPTDPRTRPGGATDVAGLDAGAVCTAVAAAELGVVLRVSPITATVLIRDALDLRHCHPLLWASLGSDPSSNPCLRRVKVHDSARKHGVDPDDAVHAPEHAVFVSDFDQYSPASLSGRPTEVVARTEEVKSPGPREPSTRDRLILQGQPV